MTQTHTLTALLSTLGFSPIVVALGWAYVRETIKGGKAS